MQKLLRSHCAKLCTAIPTESLMDRWPLHSGPNPAEGRHQCFSVPGAGTPSILCGTQQCPQLLLGTQDIRCTEGPQSATQFQAEWGGERAQVWGRKKDSTDRNPLLCQLWPTGHRAGFRWHSTHVVHLPAALPRGSVPQRTHYKSEWPAPSLLEQHCGP